MFDSRAAAIHRGIDREVPPLEVSAEVSVQLNSAALMWPSKHFALLSRGTVVVPADSVKSSDSSLIPSHKCSFVVKFSWVDTSRVPEQTFVSTLRKRCKDHPDVIDHLPWIVASMDTKYTTQTIRDNLSLEPRQRPLPGDEAQRETIQSSRVLRIIVSEELYPIANLTEADFVTVFGHIMTCACISTFHLQIFLQGGQS